MSSEDSNVSEFNPHREAEAQLDVACKILALFYNYLPLLPLSIVHWKIAKKAGLPKDQIKSLYNKIASEVDVIQVDGEEQLNSQVERMLKLIKEISMEMAKKEACKQ